MSYILNQKKDINSDVSYTYDILKTIELINFIDDVSYTFENEFRDNNDPCTTTLRILDEDDDVGIYFWIGIDFDNGGDNIIVEFTSNIDNARWLNVHIFEEDGITDPQSLKRASIINKVLKRLDRSNVIALSTALKRYKKNDSYYLVVNKDHRYDSINMYDCYELIEEVQQKIRKAIPKGNITFNNTFGNYEDGIRHYFNLNVLFYVPKCNTNAEIIFMFECDEDFKEIIISKDYSNVEIVGIDVFIPILEALKEIN